MVYYLLFHGKIHMEQEQRRLFSQFHLTDHDSHTPRMVIPARQEDGFTKLSTIVITQGDEITLKYENPIEFDRGWVKKVTGVFVFNPESEDYPVLINAKVTDNKGNKRETPFIFPLFYEGDIFTNETTGVTQIIASTSHHEKKKLN